MHACVFSCCLPVASGITVCFARNAWSQPVAAADGCSLHVFVCAPCPLPHAALWLQVFLPGALTAASRMLEPLLTNAETSRQFVERGGTDVLLKIYQLPKLTVRMAALQSFRTRARAAATLMLGLRRGQQRALTHQ